MNIIIIGAGELGQLLAARLNSSHNKITIVDTSNEGFAELHAKLDVMTLAGEATSIPVMKKAGIQRADLVLAVSGDETSNILACTIARHFGVERTICRLYSEDSFDPSEGVTPDTYGISAAFSSPRECAEKLLPPIRLHIVLEEIQFSNPEAAMVTANILDGSPLCNVRIMDLKQHLPNDLSKSIPYAEMLDHIRFAAIVRNGELMFPQGRDEILAGDCVYVAGRKDYVREFLAFAQDRGEVRKKLIVICGANPISTLVVKELLKDGDTVRVIESNQAKAEAFLDGLPPGIMLIHGDATDKDVLLEAGVPVCDAFLGTEEADERNLLSCLLAKQCHASKVIALTHKPEYIDIAPAIREIDCSFNATLVSASTIVRLMNEGIRRIDSRLLAYGAFISEFRVKSSSSLLWKPLKECHLPENTVIALVFRDGKVLAANGDTVFEEGDTIVAILNEARYEKLRPYFG